MEEQQLRPWQKLPVSCDFCHQLASWRVMAGSVTVSNGGTTIWLGTDPARHAELVCDTHHEPRQAAATREFGSSIASPLRRTWRYWFQEDTRLGRWLFQ